MFAEAVTEAGFGNFGNSWGVFAGARSNTAIFGGTNTGYLVRYQYNNFAPALFRVDSSQATEYTQIAVGNAIALQRGDTVGIRTQVVSSGVLVEATWNGEVVLSFTDTTPLTLGRFGGLRMSRSAASGTNMTGTSLYRQGSIPKTAAGVGSVAPTSELRTSVPVRVRKLASQVFALSFLRKTPISRNAGDMSASGELTKLPATVRTGSVRPAGLLSRVASKVRVGTVALVSAVRTDALQRHSGSINASGKLARKQIGAQRRNVERVDLIAPGWDAFLLRQQYITELLEQSPWRLMLEGSPVLAGSIEELRIGVNYTYGDGAPLPTEVDVDLGDGNWLPGTVTQISASRAVVSIIAGPFLKGTYPVKVRFSTAAQTPILFAGNLRVY